MPRLTLTTWRPDLFQQIRADRGRTLEQVAMDADIHVATVRSYISNNAPTPANLVALAAALDVATTDLAPLQDPPRMHELRWHAGLTVAQLATKLNLTANTIGGTLRGAAPITRPDQWAHALNTDTHTLDAAWHATREDLKRR
ncbi:helix-turn-helix domain-containing protein [Solicola sp. PLA-1-18]|uniref:helix-turn-helix domain-containing protein n=1 Tax=Solicola sp. PLA-1-18 TaxID=3380532 RepID=UPI003B7CE38C